jgi:hypothetical protein
MWCGRCNGRVFVDRVYSQKLRIELYCVMCGKRWMIRRETRFGTWLSKIEENLYSNLGISI